MSKYLEITLSLLVATAILYITFLMQQNKVPSPQQTVQENPDAFGENVTAIEMDALGKPKNVLITSQLIHYPYQDTTVFTNPHVIIYQEKEQPWHTTALQGKSRQGTEVLTLEGNVKIYQLPGPHNKALTLATESLTIYPSRDYAETSQLVTMSDAKTELKALGMRAYLKEKRVELLSQTRGAHDPVK